MPYLAGQVTLLPAQTRRLAEISTELGHAIGVVQNGNVVYVDTGVGVLALNAEGQDIHPNSDQEKLC